jgi:SAM-dependent MidA family methyltransferase
MEWALYDERSGYYGAGRVRFGARGDFTTSSGVGPLFGLCLGAWIESERSAAGMPDAFTVVELGPGDGRLAEDILGSTNAPYVCVERSPVLRARQRERLLRFGGRVRWATLEELAAEPVTGAVIANEVFDALAVHRVRVVDGSLEELFVEGAAESWRPSESERLLDHVQRYAPWAFGAGRSPEIEVGLDALDMLERLAAALEHGSVAIIDYGDEAAALYGPHRPHGTVRAFREHRLSADVLQMPGEQDITASVNFTAIADHARELGFAVERLTTQGEFLRRAGIAELAARVAADPNATVAERLAAKTLLVPGGFGDAFKVLVMRK